MITDKPREECGICGIFGHPEAAKLAYLALYALQHRGQEGAGIVAADGAALRVHKGEGLVADVFGPSALDGLPGHIAIGHVRYSTTGASHLRNVAPFTGRRADGGWVAVAHNGNLVNAPRIKLGLEQRGVAFESTTDSEGIMHAIRLAAGATLAEQAVEGLAELQGAFSLAIMSEQALVAARDSNGFRPLCLGRLKGGGYAVASESCAFDLIEAEYVRDVEPGEVLEVSASGLRSLRPFPPARQSSCIFEFIYFSRPDSTVFNAPVHVVRKELGRQLAWEAPAAGDVVVPVPDSGNVAAMGYADVSRIPYELGLVRNHYVGRTFIEPSQAIRDFGVKIKLNPVKSVIAGKRVILVDDSLVRGTTMRKICKMVKQAGAKEIHVRISSPPHRSPCYYGIDFPTSKELIATTHSKEEIRRFIGVTTIEYISLEGLLKAVRNVSAGFCLACFDSRYPVLPADLMSKDALERASIGSPA
ncbi:MAG: amidophosphoribosyltransferase [bacterium]